ncbi:MAG: hypothetical protein GC145_15415 [Caulobacter sp.]|nr:hypothetical protein [Caulobacter sp.]
MARFTSALTLSVVLGLSAGAVRAGAAEPSAAAVFSRGMSEVCAPWQEGAEQKALYRSLKGNGWNVDLLPRMEGAWGSAQFQPRRYDEKRGCNAMLTLSSESEKAGATRAALDWVARKYPQIPMTNQNKPVQIASGPVHAWTWVGETTTITFYVADKVAGVEGPHVVLSIKPR